MLFDVFEEHLAEAGFLWTQWERALVSPAFILEESAAVEERLVAHLDGLVVAGAAAVEPLQARLLEGEDPGAVFASAWALLSLAPAFVLDVVKAGEGAYSPECWAALHRALELAEGRELEAALASWLHAGEGRLRALALDVLSFRGRAPVGAALELLGQSEDLAVAAALRALRPSARSSPPRELGVLLKETRPEIRRAAVDAGLMFGLSEALAATRADAVSGTGAVRKSAWTLLALMGEARDLERLSSLTTDVASREDALWALGYSGRRDAADACVVAMAGPTRVAQLAGEAFAAITGLVLEGAYVMEEDAAEDALPPLEEDDLDADLSLRPEDALPRPNPEAVAHWWQVNRKDFVPGSRYLRGHVFTGARLLDALTHEPMRRRQVHAWELMLRTRGAWHVEVREFSVKQQVALERAAEIRERLPSWPFGT
ncbi:hypothetical protein DRW03_16405 [Corallococcus sp. H22C18031201]|uniref:TIGR02270 family protein n=1 Tax=Citreicoccus inhibens TaxID=2849499 RepID=UPI000E76F392|nr:TIGR02270 family protein [Citreicoccus inhibens]MBU8896796.1 TIGR02270 family protein [Citreicoccus inhibens]RJS21910.1 hypothetical protein DRW03_16405 [Corallococcus sp. H22C18031201]